MLSSKDEILIKIKPIKKLKPYIAPSPKKFFPKKLKITKMTVASTNKNILFFKS